MMTRKDFKTAKDYKNHLINLETTRHAIQKMAGKIEVFERIATFIKSYKKIEYGYMVKLDNGMEIRLVEKIEGLVPKPQKLEDVIVTINDKFYSPIYWNNCYFVSFDSRIRMSGTILDYKKYIAKFTTK